MAFDEWRPSARLSALRARAALLAQIRAFFAGRGVLEVETPLLCRAAGSDPNLQAIRATGGAGGQGEIPLYLQTSPEFAMKRLLAAGAGPVFQLCKAFREGERGRRHNPEFTLLEWYRPGFDEHALMDEVEALLSHLLSTLGGAGSGAGGISAGEGALDGRVERVSYRALFRRHLGLDPHAASTEELAARAGGEIEVTMKGAGREEWLDLLYSHLIEPRLRGRVFIHDFPASQAALARVEADAEGMPVARRFELVIGGLEIANGYHELADAAEQRRRFERDLAVRARRGQDCPPLDERLLAALEHGLPDCAGVALGVDRLLMVLTDAGSIDEVLAFPLERA